MANMAEKLSKRLMAKAEASWERNGISDQERIEPGVGKVWVEPPPA
jgi:hypothetical protein